MTQLRSDPNAISNYFNKVLNGIGHRGSSFTDVDALTHDLRTHRFLIQEFKRPHESLSQGQRMVLCDLALEPRFTVWYVQKWHTLGMVAWADMRWPDSIDVLTEDEYRDRFRAWWENSYDLSRHTELTEEIPVRLPIGDTRA